MKIIIVEGPDSVGKSTISKELAKILGAKRFRNRNDVKNFYAKTPDITIAEMMYLVDFLGQTGEGTLVLDRFHPTEYVYSKVFGRERNEKAVEEMDTRLKSLNACIVYCYKNEYRKYEDQFIEFEKIEELKAEYISYLTNVTKLPTVWLNTASENLEHQILEILKGLVAVYEKNIL